MFLDFFRLYITEIAIFISAAVIFFYIASKLIKLLNNTAKNILVLETQENEIVDIKADVEKMHMHIKAAWKSNDCLTLHILNKKNYNISIARFDLYIENKSEFKKYLNPIGFYSVNQPINFITRLYYKISQVNIVDCYGHFEGVNLTNKYKLYLAKRDNSHICVFEYIKHGSTNFMYIPPAFFKQLTSCL